MPIAGVGVKPDGTLGWIDADGNEVNPDGTPIEGAQQLQRLPPAANTAGQSATQTPAAATQTPPAAAPATSTSGGTSGGTTNQTAPGLNPYGTAGEPSVNGLGSRNTSQTTPATSTPGQGQGQSAPTDLMGISQQAYDQLQAAQKTVAQIDTSIADTQRKISALGPNGLNTQAGQTLQDSLNSLQMQRTTSAYQMQQASDRYVQVATQAYNSGQLTGPQVAQINAQVGTLGAQQGLYSAQAQGVTQGQIPLQLAQAGLAGAQGLGITQGQIPLQLAQAGLAGAQGLGITQGQVPLQLAQAQGVLQGQIPQQQAAAVQALGQGNLANAQAGNIAALTPGAVGLQGAQTNLYSAQGVQSEANAAANLAQIQAAQQQSLYNLQDRVNTVKNIVFGPGGSGNPAEANDLLNQYTTAAIGGTTPAAAAQQTGVLQANNYGTQMAGINALQNATANRAQAYQGLAGNLFGTLAQMNEWAPKGSTAMGGAFNALLNDMASRLQQPQFATQAVPQAPALPSFLQNFAGSGQPAAALTGGNAAAPPPAAAAPAPAANTAPATGLAPAPGQNPGLSNFAGASSGGLPSFLQGYAPPNPLQSGGFGINPYVISPNPALQAWR